MEALSPITDDDEREDGEIVDDDFEGLEDISNYSIPSCGKSDNSRDLFRTISLSSISESDNDECVFVSFNNYQKHCDDFLSYQSKPDTFKSHHRNKQVSRACPPAAVHSVHCKRKRKRGGRKFRRFRVRDADVTHRTTQDEYALQQLKACKHDEKTLQQLKEAIRINGSSNEDKDHLNPLKKRLKCMLKDVNFEESQDSCKDFQVDTDPVSDNDEAMKKQEEQIDKELNDLRLEALKSAVLRKAKERKNKLNQKLEQNSNECKNDLKEQNNKENHLSTKAAVEETKPKEKVPENAVEEDVDIMRAMLLASMSQKITKESTASKELISKSTVLKSKPVQLNQSVTPLNSETINKADNLISRLQPQLAPIKPIIIRVNGDSDSDSDLDLDFEEKPTAVVETTKEIKENLQRVSTKVSTATVTSVDEFLRKQREQFEAKLKNNESKLKDNSVLKLLSKDQQQEYQQLQRKLIALKRERRKNSARKSITIDAANDKEAKSASNQENNVLKPTKSKRLQVKGKYKPLSPLLRKVNVVTLAKKKCEERVKMLLEQLHYARKELAEHHQKHTVLVKELAVAKEEIDRKERLNSSPVATKNTKTVVETINAANLKSNSLPKLQMEEGTQEVPQLPLRFDADDCADETKEINKEENKVSSYVSPLDKRETPQNNPLEMLCPYELFGICKDKSCKFNHCPA